MNHLPFSFFFFFFWSENLYLINFGKIFSLYKKIFGWLFLYVSTLKMSFYHLLALILSDKKSDSNLTFVAFYIISFSPCCFQDFTFMIVVRCFFFFFFLSISLFSSREGNGNPLQPTPVSLRGKSHGQRSLVGCSPWGHKESGRTEWLTLTHIVFLAYFFLIFYFCFRFIEFLGSLGLKFIVFIKFWNF